MSDIATMASEKPVTAQDAKEAAKEKGQQLRTQAAERMRQEASQRSRQAAEQVQTFAQTMRRNASELRAQGQQGQSAVLDQLAIRAEQVAGYLTQADPDQLLGAVQDYGRRAVSFVRQKPWVAAVGGLGLGALVSRQLSGSSNGSSGQSS